MKKMIVGLLVMWAMGTSVVLGGVKIGDRITITSPTLYCMKFDKNMAKYFLVGLVKGAQGSNGTAYAEKVSNGNCSFTSQGPTTRNLKVLSKKHLYVSPKELSLLNKKATFEVLKLYIPRAKGSAWFVFSQDTLGYKIER